MTVLPLLALPRLDRTLPVPRPELFTRSDLEKAIRDVRASTGREPTNQELADALTAIVRQPIRAKLVSQKKVRYGLGVRYLSHREVFGERDECK